MKIELNFAELHNPLFHAGTNWGNKLDVNGKGKGKLVLAYDRENKELLVESKGMVSIIPTSNVVSMIPKTESIQKVPENSHPTHTKGKVKAQVGGPQEHVFAGPGAGKNRA